MRILSLTVLFSATLFAQNAPSLQFRGSQPSQHATVNATPADVAGMAGAKVMLFVDVEPKPTIHVYAPGSRDYIPIELKLTTQPEVKVGKLSYPKSDTMTFGDEKVQVFQKPFRLTQEITLARTLKSGTTTRIAGTVHLQACDDKVCFAPENVPVSWNVVVK